MKKKIRQKLKRVKKLRTWQLVVILILMCFVGATLLRLDHIGMVQRRQAVLDADEAGDRELLERNLATLRRYVLTHMNANTGEFHLVHQYERDAREVLERAREYTSIDNPHGNIFRLVADICDPLAQRFGWGYSQPYFDCIERELSNFAALDYAMPEVQLPRTELYRLSYISPIWTPSLTGFVILFCIFLTVVILWRIVVIISLKIMLMNAKD
ncbi:hypothetical protein FWD07_02830 [Candidatus Saccharibacteria bacterium]|nr:hypothetical protein [Candidatus Saccharibacteria bacterium]